MFIPVRLFHGLKWPLFCGCGGPSLSWVTHDAHRTADGVRKYARRETSRHGDAFLPVIRLKGLWRQKTAKTGISPSNSAKRELTRDNSAIVRQKYAISMTQRRQKGDFSDALKMG